MLCKPTFIDSLYVCFLIIVLSAPSLKMLFVVGVDNVGSCRYESLCDMLNKISDTLCPILNPYKLPCKCPIPSGTYSVGPQTLFIKDPGLSWLANGTFCLTAVHATLFFNIYSQVTTKFRPNSSARMAARWVASKLSFLLRAAIEMSIILLK